MIAFLRGSVVHAAGDSIVLDIGAMGMTVTCTPATVLSVRIGESCQLLTSLVIREDAWTIYGFREADEKAVFELVQTVTGIGPRIALALVATLSPDEVRQAVHAENLAALTKVPGLGRKGAQRLVLELKDRIGPAQSAAESEMTVAAGWQASVQAGLVSLGWNAREAEAAVTAVADQAGDEPDVPALLKAALRSLDRA